MPYLNGTWTVCMSRPVLLPEPLPGRPPNGLYWAALRGAGGAAGGAARSGGAGRGDLKTPPSSTARQGSERHPSAPLGRMSYASEVLWYACPHHELFAQPLRNSAMAKATHHEQLSASDH